MFHKFWMLVEFNLAFKFNKNVISVEEHSALFSNGRLVSPIFFIDVTTVFMNWSDM